MRPSVFASVVVPLLGFAQAHGLDRGRLLGLGGLTDAALADPDELVPYECLVVIWRELLAAHPGEPLGLRYAATWSLDALGIVGYSLRHARNGHEALALTIRLARLADPFIRFHVVSVGGRHEIRLEHERRVVDMVEPLEMLVLTMVRSALGLVREEVRPFAVCFRHAARHPLADYETVLGPGVPVHFGAAFDGASFDSALLDLPLAKADPRIAAYLARHAETLLDAVPDGPVTLDERVRSEVRSALGSGALEAPDIARKLGIGVRSLQRALQQRGTSLSREVDAVRKERALVLVRRPELSVAEIAFLLGYAESRVFHRSFRRWTGMSPTEFRRIR